MCGGLIEGLGIPACQFGGAGHQGDGVTLKDCIEERQRFVPKSVASVSWALVGHVFPKGQPVPGYEGVDSIPCHTEERTEEGEAVVKRGHGCHSGEAGESGAAAEVGENGLRLIIGVVGKEDEAGAVLGGGAAEKGVALGTGGGLDGLAAGLGEGRDQDFLDLAGEVVFPREAADEGGVLAGLPAPQSVVQMAEDEVGAAGLQEEMEQGDGVPSAGNGEEGFPEGEAGKEFRSHPGVGLIRRWPGCGRRRSSAEAVRGFGWSRLAAGTFQRGRRRAARARCPSR